VDFADGESFTVRADHRALSRVFSNLISNAVKFSPTGATVPVTVRNETDKGLVRVAVQDQGPGLTEEERTHLFTPYQRFSAKPTGDESSTGLGLSIAHDIIRKLDGQIGCDSVPNAGACFWFSLPAA
jgi:signal transduction histidine kinase